jgi:hypothetical protein
MHFPGRPRNIFKEPKKISSSIFQALDKAGPELEGMT